MAQFPTLKTGAVAQYPASYTVTYRADVVPFLDGTEQRFRNAPLPVLYQWQIDLRQLDEAEMASVETFFLENQGAADTFAFTDPWSGTTYQNCSIVSDELTIVYSGPMSSSTRIAIRQNRT